jgi:hypothetical protein
MPFEQTPNMSLNGLAVAEIERRCRPLLDGGADGSPLYDDDELAKHPDENEFVDLLRSMRSRCGFLAFGESLAECIESDRVLCQSLNVEREALLARLRSLVEQFEAAVAAASASSSVGSIVTREMKLGDGNVSLLVTRIESRGFQRSPFVNLDSDSPDSAWNVEYHILNRALAPGNVTLKIGGSLRFGALQFVEQFAFFGGGGGAAALRAVEAGHPPVRNEYRVDPALTLAVLSGSWNAPARAAYSAQLRLERLVLEQQIDRCRSDVLRCRKAVQQCRTALEAARDDREAVEMAKLELDEAIGESLFADETLAFLIDVQMAGVDAALSEF